VRDAPRGQREPLIPILDASFTGLYQRHAKRTVVDVETVKVAWAETTPVGLVMLKILSQSAGYVYYIAVLPSYRRRGIARLLMQAALDHFSHSGAAEVYATVGEDNEESNGLFKALGFVRTDLGQVSRKYGTIQALSMYRGMWVVPGEIVLVRGAEPPALASGASDLR